MHEFQINFNFCSQKNKALSAFLLLVSLTLFFEVSIGASSFISIPFSLVPQSNIPTMCSEFFPKPYALFPYECYRMTIIREKGSRTEPGLRIQTYSSAFLLDVHRNTSFPHLQNNCKDHSSPSVGHLKLHFCFLGITLLLA